MDRLYFRYLLERKGHSPEDLERLMGWSPGTRYSRMQNGDNWRVHELRILLSMGFTEAELAVVFLGEEKEEKR